MYFKNIYKTLMRLEQLEQNRMKVKKLQALMLARYVAVCSVTPKHYAKIVQLAPLFLSAQQNGHTFPYKKLPLVWSPVNTAKGHILKSQTVESLLSSPR